MEKNKLIVVRGAGDIATGTIVRLVKAGFPVLVLETAHPSAIRRYVALSEAVYEGKASVEDVTAVRISSLDMADKVIAGGEVPLLIDPEGSCIPEVRPLAVVDAIIAKKNMGTGKWMAPLTIALGPGFRAGIDVDYVIETNRGHNLGRIIESGSAQPNTGVPGVIGGYGAERVIHASHRGVLRGRKAIGDMVEQGDVIADIWDGNEAHPVQATIAGLIRGMIRDGFPTEEGFKIADIDPRREEYDNCFTISEKARCIAGSVLELVCRAYLARQKGKT